MFCFPWKAGLPADHRQWPFFFLFLSAEQLRISIFPFFRARNTHTSTHTCTWLKEKITSNVLMRYFIKSKFLDFQKSIVYFMCSFCTCGNWRQGHESSPPLFSICFLFFFPSSPPSCPYPHFFLLTKALFREEIDWSFGSSTLNCYINLKH